MSVALAAPPGEIRVLRAPALDPPFDDELSPSVYVPAPRPEPMPLPPEAIAGASRDSQMAARRFVDRCLETFNGFRSPAQLRPMLHIEHAHEVLEEIVQGVRRLTAARRRSRVHKVVRCKQIRVCEPRPGAAEVAAVLSDGRHTWSICYRLELIASTWRCSVLQCLPL